MKGIRNFGKTSLCCALLVQWAGCSGEETSGRGNSIEKDVDSLCETAVACTQDRLEPTTHEQCVAGWFLDEPEPCPDELAAWVGCLADVVADDCETWETWQTDGNFEPCSAEGGAYIECG